MTVSGEFHETVREEISFPRTDREVGYMLMREPPSTLICRGNVIDGCRDDRVFVVTRTLEESQAALACFSTSRYFSFRSRAISIYSICNVIRALSWIATEKLYPRAKCPQYFCRSLRTRAHKMSQRIFIEAIKMIRESTHRTQIR